MLFTVLVVLCYCTTVSSTDQYYVVTESTTDCLPADGVFHFMLLTHLTSLTIPSSISKKELTC